MSVRVGVLGAGTISEEYLTNLTSFPDLDVTFVADLDVERARAQAERHGVPHWGTGEELLAGDAEIVVNLTQPAFHVSTGQAVLAAGKHLWVEKPLALDPESATALLDAARAAGRRVAGAPDTFLGAGLQTALRAVADGLIGRPSSALVAFATAGPQRWHPAPEFLFSPGGGPLMDLGPYYLTALVQMLGPVTEVTALGASSQQTRTIGDGPRAGLEFPVLVDTTVSAMLRFASGAHAAATFSFDSGVRRAQLDLTGELGTLVAPDPNRFAGDVVIHSNRGDEPVQVPTEGTTTTRGIGVVEMARAIAAGRTPRADGALMAHVVEVMWATLRAIDDGGAVAVTSTAPISPPLPARWDPHEDTGIRLG
ncbi:Gfo/Idh/MocA family oxidoreductase [Georgenia sp. MJ173]|uniref:Gfo/Idh/MocA family protein n=1 Tax=Georgenia sunbinii TaxID=3117728 RepID=UPI002F26927E